MSSSIVNTSEGKRRRDKEGSGGRDIGHLGADQASVIASLGLGAMAQPTIYKSFFLYTVDNQTEQITHL